MRGGYARLFGLAHGAEREHAGTEENDEKREGGVDVLHGWRPSETEWAPELSEMERALTRARNSTSLL